MPSEKMAGLSVRNMEKDGSTFRALDRKLERSKLGTKKVYDRSYTSEQLKEMGAKIELSLEHVETNEKEIQIANSLECISPALYTDVKQIGIHQELSCFVPVFYWLMKTSESDPMTVSVPYIYHAIGKILTIGWDFQDSVWKENGTLVKKKSMARLRLFAENCRLIHEYAPEFIFLIVTPLYFTLEMRRKLVCIEDGRLLRHGRGAFQSQLKRFKSQSISAAVFDE